jgi:hypothetical protein
MVTVQILSEDDPIHPDDWCRPLVYATGHVEPPLAGSDAEWSEYGGLIVNNLKWARVREVFGETHWNKSRRQLISEASTVPHVFLYEFVRGQPPAGHCVTRVRRKDAD